MKHVKLNLSLALCFFVVACAGGSKVVVRDVPSGLAPIGAMLDGCEHGSDVDGSTIARCDGDVLFRVREVEIEEGAPPRYFGDGVDLANLNAGKMSWEQMQLKTAYDKGFVDRGDVRAVDDDRVVFVLIGAARPHGGGTRTQTESSCQAPPESFDRCTSLLTAFLDLPVANDAPKSSGGVSNGAIGGRAISFPTSCRTEKQTTSQGRYTCDDGAALYWLTTDDMDDAAAQAEGAMLAQEDADERKQVRCDLLDADTQCEATSTALVGLGYLEGKPLVVVCVAPSSSGDVWDHGLCKSAFKKR